MQGLRLSIQCIKKLCFDNKVCISISSTDDNKSLEMLYGIVPKGKKKDTSSRLFYPRSNKLKIRKIFYNSST